MTAVEWLLFELSKFGHLPHGVPFDIHQQAKEIEKEQTINFADSYVDNCVIPKEDMAIPTIMDTEEYYNKTFNKK